MHVPGTLYWHSHVCFTHINNVSMRFPVRCSSERKRFKMPELLLTVPAVWRDVSVKYIEQAAL
jgi:hypothetical protein